MEEKKKLEKKETRGGKRPNAGRKAITKNNSILLSWRISEDFRNKLQEFAQNEKMTVSDFLRFLVLQYERTHTHPAQKEP